MESDQTRALSIARAAGLPHPGRPLVEAFLNDAVDCDRAAKYLLQTYADGESGVNLTRFLDDWKDLVRLFSVDDSHPRNLSWASRQSILRRDNYRCCLTRERCRFWNIWNVFPIIPPAAFGIREQRLYGLLGAFTTPLHRDLLKDRNSETQTRNYLTLSKDAAIAFSTGWIRLEHLKGTEYNILFNHTGTSAAIYTIRRSIAWKCDLAGHSNSGAESPGLELLEIHSRFSKVLKWADIATKINSRPCLQPSRNIDSSPFSQTTTTIFLGIWSKVPDFIRLQTYRILRTAGSCLYGPTTDYVQRLPFGMYLKYGPAFPVDRYAREFHALKLVRRQTSVPVPYPIDLLVSRTESFLVTSRIDGGPAGQSLDECSDEELYQMGRDLHSWIAELHAIKSDRDSNYAITSATGGPCLDYRIGDDPAGPFHNEKDFSKTLCLGILPDLMHRTDHEIVFTHADLNLRNILVKDRRIVGIVDWENAGWYPEYWEYTKCHFGIKYAKRWLGMLETVFENKYRAELEIERQYWEYNAWAN